MNRNISDRIMDHFASLARDVSPSDARHSARVLYAPACSDPEITHNCTFVLSDDELQRAGRFSCESDRALFVQRRAFRRFCAAIAIGSSQLLARIDFAENENGRPYLSGAPGTWFSFSSCRFGLLGAWSSTHGVGVDLEDESRNLEAAELAHHYFSAAEAKTVEAADGPERLRIFFQLWCLKEAALKSIGEGLPFGLDAFEFELTASQRVVHAPHQHGGRDLFSAFMIRGTGHCATLVTRSPS